MKGKPVAVLGAGSFGSAVALLLSYNNPVIIYSRRKEVVDGINNNKILNGNYPIVTSISASSDLEMILEKCSLIFPVVPSANFRSMIRDLTPFLQPHHILIHGTKGFDIDVKEEKIDSNSRIQKSQIKTMSEVIAEETNVIRTGCFSGPNLADEILRGYPAAGVIASKFDEVIRLGQQALTSSKFSVFGSNDIKGAELAGALKNIIGLGSGIIGGLGMGKNLEALLITRGLREMIIIGKNMGAENSSFLGTAGIGDLIATATSNLSRNYSFGEKIGKGMTKDEIIASGHELAEGVRTLKIIRQYNKTNGITDAPIIEMLYQVIYEDFSTPRAVHYLMKFPYVQDVDFL